MPILQSRMLDLIAAAEAYQIQRDYLAKAILDQVLCSSHTDRDWFHIKTRELSSTLLLPPTHLSTIMTEKKHFSHTKRINERQAARKAKKRSLLALGDSPPLSDIEQSMLASPATIEDSPPREPKPVPQHKPPKPAQHEEETYQQVLERQQAKLAQDEEELKQFTGKLF